MAKLPSVIFTQYKVTTDFEMLWWDASAPDVRQKQVKQIVSKCCRLCFLAPNVPTHFNTVPSLNSFKCNHVRSLYFHVLSINDDRYLQRLH